MEDASFKKPGKNMVFQRNRIESKMFYEKQLEEYRLLFNFSWTELGEKAIAPSQGMRSSLNSPYLY